ncbi:MAG: hypothetical protein QXP66_00950 [Candidatus Aenigmatarchaeota archaeon]
MAKFNVDRGGMVLDSPVSGTFVEGTALALTDNGWAVIPGKYSLARYVTAGYHSNRDDVKLLKIARLVIGPMVATTDQVWGTPAILDMVVPSGGKLVTTTVASEAVGYVVGYSGGLYTIQFFK